MDTATIIAKLPYEKPFLFVDSIIRIDENGVEGTYLFDPELDFYQGHFKENPITPGVILTETMAQIGVVCLGIFLIDDTFKSKSIISLTSTQIEFLKPVYPGEKVTVISEKKYFRFGKLKCNVSMKNEQQQIVCRGIIAGMMINQ